MWVDIPDGVLCVMCNVIHDANCKHTSEMKT